MAEIKNPNLEPGADRRIFLLFAVILAVTFLSQSFFQKPASKTDQAPQSQPSDGKQSTTSAPAVTGASPPATSLRKPAAVAAKQAAQETETVIENDLYRVTSTNRGGQVKSWILKKHQDDHGKPLDMVNQRAAAEHGLPLSFFTHDEALRNRLNTVLYVPSVAGENRAPTSVTYEYAEGDLQVTKKFAFDHTYEVRIETAVTQNGVPVQALPAWPSGLGDQVTGPQFATAQISWSGPDGIHRKAARAGFIFKEHVSDRNMVSGPFSWAGIVDQYFAAIFMPDQPRNAALVQFHKTIVRNPDEKDEAKRKSDVVSVLGVAVGNPAGTTSARLFVGPKDLDSLQEVRTAAADGDRNGPSLEQAIDFGFFGILAKPLFLWLNWTHDNWIPNWGWAIIFLTVVINVVLFPLRYLGMRSSYKQQKVQPEVQAISAKYRGLKITDPRQAEKQREIQAVYKREGINPAAGCLPMLLQIPILFAFYSMLTVANELRHAPWLWIKDLAAPDPFYVLPIGIVVSMYVMQKVTPMAGMDAQQVKMMQIMMPIMIGAISLTLPAGLGVYWVTGNIIGYFAQMIMNNSKIAREAREHLAKREERKRKRG